MRRREARPHICLAVKPLGTIEHSVIIAEQAEQAGVDVCWIEPAEARGPSEVRPYLDAHGVRADVSQMSSPGALTRHLRRSGSLGVFVQSPYPEHFPDWLWEVTTRLGRLCYAGYGILIAVWDAGLFGLDTFRRASWLIADSPYSRGRYVEHGVDADRIVVGGNPLMWTLRRRASMARPPERPTILWAPHWSQSWFEYPRGYSRWAETTPALRSFAAEHPEVDVVIRPHPLLLEEIDSSTTDTEAASAFRALIDLPNVRLSDRSMLDDILSSTALLTDGIAIIAYYAATGRPLAVIRDAASPPFNELGDAICAASDVVGDAAEIEAWLRRATNGLPVSAERAALSRSLHPTHDASPIAIWKDHVLTPAGRR
ncbi:MAG: hypothetical protein QM598_07385 [Protaetiibacter sp.]